MCTEVIDGRWSDQLARLHATGLPIFVIVEGDLSDTSLSYNALLGACVNVELRKNSHLIRSCDVQETAAFLRHLVQKCDGAPPALPPSRRPPGTSKRKRDAELETCWVRMLTCIPSVSERVAAKLIQHFGNLTALVDALADEKNFPMVRLYEKSCLGKARIRHLANYLTAAP